MGQQGQSDGFSSCQERKSTDKPVHVDETLGTELLVKLHPLRWLNLNIVNIKATLKAKKEMTTIVCPHTLPDTISSY